MALILWTVLGGLTGGFAKSVFWYETSKGWLPCTVFGIAGGIAGGCVRGFDHGFELSSMALSLVGAAIVLSVYNMVVHQAQLKTSGRRAA